MTYYLNPNIIYPWDTPYGYNVFWRYLNEINKNSLLQVDNSCVSCKICEKNCPMDIAPYDFKDDVLSHPDCIQCNNYVYACPQNSINYNSENEVEEDISREA